MTIANVRSTFKILGAAAAVLAITAGSALPLTMDDILGDMPRVSLSPLQKALKLLETNEFDAAEKIARDVIAENPISAPAYEVLGVVLALRSDLPGATAALERAVQLDQKQSSAITKLGDIRLATGDRDGAKKKFEEAIAVDPSDRHANQRLGLIAESLGQTDEAVSRFEKGIVGTAPDYVGIKVNLAQLYNQRGRFTQSRDLLKPYADLKDREPLAHRALANAYLGLGALPDAIAQYRIALALAPKDRGARIGFGIALRDVGSKQESLDVLRDVGAEFPKDPLVQTELAKSFAAVGQTAEAQQVLERVRVENPDNLPVTLALADLYAVTGNRAGAIGIYEQQMAKGNAAPEVYVSLGALQQGAGDYQDADKTFRAMMVAYPKSSEPYFRLGSLLGLQRRYKDAADQFDAGLEINANNPSLLKASSLAYQRMGQGVKGVERAKKLAETTKSADDQFFLATLQEGTGDTQGAIDTYKAIIQTDAKYWQAMNNLAFMLSARGKPEIAEAVKLATQAAALAPDQPIVIDTLGWTQLRAGDAKAAKSALLKATELAPDNAKYHYHLALAERALNNKAAAIASLKKAISLNPNDAEMKRVLRQVETSR